MNARIARRAAKAHLMTVTVSMRVMSAGKGYDYFLRTVAAGDGDRSLTGPLTRYYTEAGTPPGRWAGSGLAYLAPNGLHEDDEVTEEQLQLLLGSGKNPVDRSPLGRAFPVYRTFRERVKERTDALDPDLSSDERKAAVDAIEREEAARGSRRTVAGYDYTFSLPKSASVLWGIADAGTQALIARAHHDAIADILNFMEREVAATRIGATGTDGAIAQVETLGLIAATFDHYDSRAGDPHLHTHVVISNKVKTTLDGKWRSLDGRPMHAATVALSELHEAVVADHLTRALGVEWESRPRGRDRNPAWAISTVPEALIQEFSTRAHQIDEAVAQLINEYAEAHGRQPSRATILKLRAQATLSTRPEKQIHSLAELTSAWRKRAETVLEGRHDRRLLPASQSPAGRLFRADDVTSGFIEEIGSAVMTAVSDKRSTWRRWNLVAETARQTMSLRFAAAQDREAITNSIVEAAERASLRLTPPELARTPVRLQRADGSSAFRPKHSTVYSSQALLDAEARLLARSRAMTAPVLPLDTIEASAHRPDRNGRLLGADQAQALTRIALSGRSVDVLVGPAGAGKTTAMAALRRAWEAVHGAGSVVGLAPSESAAHVLAEDLGIPTANTAMWWTRHVTGGTTFAPGQLVIIDEAGLAGTLSLDRITAIAERVGAKVLLVGDYFQLQAVEAAGAFGLLVNDRDDAPTLEAVHRFTNEWERSASLGLRLGEPGALDGYEQHERITGGETDDMIAAAYEAWQHDRAQGRATVLVADSTRSVTALNERARVDLILSGSVRPERGEVALADGTHASEGDSIITRRNDRRLRAGRNWVRNGSRWTISKVRTDGSILIRPADSVWGGTIVLPAAYVEEAVDLGYAVTSFRAQGITVDTAHALVDPTMTRETFYVAMTRGRDANHAYVATDHPDESHQNLAEVDTPPAATAHELLLRVLAHSGAELSAHETITVEQQRWTSIAQLAAEYETIAVEAQRARWVQLVEKSGLTPDQVSATLDSEAFGALAAELRRAEANGHDVDRLLPRLVRARTFEDADDPAAVLHYRVARVTAHTASRTRPAPSQRLIAGLIPAAVGVTDPDMRAALAERHALITNRAAALAEQAIADPDSWARAVGPRPAAGAAAEAWIASVQTISAYRDRYTLTGTDPVGPAPSSIVQRIDHARAVQALRRAQDLARPAQRVAVPETEPLGRSGGRSL